MKTTTLDIMQKFVGETNASNIDSVLLERFERVTGYKPHHYLRRGIIFCHRDLNAILDKYERGQPFYLFTGRGPSSDSLHIGHSIPFKFTKWLQDVFKAHLIIMLTDDMKLLHSKDLTVQDVRRFAIDNAKDILAFGFNPSKTFMFSNLDFVGGAFYENIVGVARHIQVKSIKDALSFGDDDNVGMFYCCSTQSAGALATSFPGILGTNQDQLESMPCLIACSYDIDGYFSEIRKHAETLGYQKPAFLYSSLLTALQGADAKMSASIHDSAIFLTDDPSTIRAKLTLAFPTHSGEGMDMGIGFQYLRFFMDNDEEFESLEHSFQAKTLTTEHLRATLTELVQEQVARFQENRVQITDDYLKSIMKPRLLD